jgi:uncharacterized membrane protein
MLAMLGAGLRAVLGASSDSGILITVVIILAIIALLVFIIRR